MTTTHAFLDEEKFICPECGSRRSSGHVYRDPAWTFGSGEPKSPWDTVLQAFDCAECFNTIPGHLAQRWEGRTVKGARLEWVSVFRSLRDEDKVRLIELLAAGWEIAGQGNDCIEVWEDGYEVCASLDDLIEDINCESDEGVDWSFLVSLDGMRKGSNFLTSQVTNLEELLSLIDGVTLDEHEWSGGDWAGVYKHVLVQKVKRYGVIKVLNAVASELGKQIGLLTASR